ncbi:uncharacterized protein LAESUDRAFT_815105 [Laetiporus sulphureus 93-53]|uniref:Uncharacterized protein n=1 Tax=Laetiporus sulphureus 93-53 TaxID=1314785 RepID=A0A165CEH3_9APHY|nr:uncharacterized protein LAESUDRAFT_815105 [Laetiporus sulphureus 93-53]KZT02668.1 hypothetical protein LAESUDRAFT_815105 [Laetiporus sulphureus 93-53]
MSEVVKPPARNDISVASFGLNAFSDLSPQQKEDAVYSMLFGRFAANGSADPRDDPQKWAAQFQSNLENVGWVVTSSSNSTATIRTGSVDDLVLTALENETTWTRHEYALAVRALYALQAAGADSEGQELMNGDAISKSKHASFFQIAVAVPAEGNIQLRLLTFLLEMTDVEMTSVLGTRWNLKQAQWTTTHQTMELNEEVYAKVRDSIADRLQGAGALESIAAVPF